MSLRSLNLSDELHRYMLDVSLRDNALLEELRAETARLDMGRMQISPEQGQLMALLVRLIDARRAIEIGVFTGYSSLLTAIALPSDGRLIACDVSEQWTAIGQRYWEKAGVADRIDLHLRPALETLEMLAAGGSPPFDFAFIDADKTNYDAYYEGCLSLLRPGGIVLIDNVLWGGSVIDPAKQDEDTKAIRALNKKLRDDDRIDLSMIPIGDGLSLCRKR
ncbi:MAG: class I SAM-dependent methyltransferase [Leptospiraceae bacterium]|nr:class I SAM-dependent methyltransferase [Leptospiraceae bacterium]